ncbi:hypothetical protein LSTR_LSTR017169 [Laodelphax striatellus]|uniref:5'-nucleotidase n=1 Tax=Laodelphax striatellus TaxID=195883 RepID=A0A482WV30_LAOST|nr:hypothetical protein LSTR_LSTR017169 [Laodelphax striatellus]
MISDHIFLHFQYLKKSETPKKGWTDTSIALIQAGGLRNSIDVASSGGDVTYVDLITTMPFEDFLVRMTLKGSCLKEALEWGARNIRASNYDLDGAFLHSSEKKMSKKEAIDQAEKRHLNIPIKPLKVKSSCRI